MSPFIETIKLLETVTRRPMTEITVECSYDLVGLVERTAARYEGHVVNGDYTDKVRLSVELPVGNRKAFIQVLVEESAGKIMLNKNLMATVNSDDPAYFGGYINENYIQIAKALDLSKEDIFVLVENSFKASFLSKEEISVHLEKLQSFKDN